MLWGIVNLIIILLLILTNGFLAMSELAVISSSKTRLQRRAEEGNSNARAALDLAGNPHRFLATVQIGITLIGVLSGLSAVRALPGDWLNRFPRSRTSAAIANRFPLHWLSG